MNKLKILILIIISLVPLYGISSAPVVVLPERFQGEKVIIVNTPEYNSLVSKNQALSNQLKEEEANWISYSEEVSRQQKVNYETQSKLLKDYNLQKTTIEHQGKVIAQRNLTIVGLVGAISIIILGFLAALYFKVLHFGFI